MKSIDELWYGNIAPFEQCNRGDKRLKELLKLVARNREELDGTLTDKQKETLEKYEDCNFPRKFFEKIFLPHPIFCSFFVLLGERVNSVMQEPKKKAPLGFLFLVLKI